MKKTLMFLVFLLIAISCQESMADKPGNLIAEDKMINILSDIAILEAIKVENPGSLTDRNIVPDKYIYKKYKIDSLQFANSNKYYASDVNNYSKMYEKVSQNIEKKQKEIEILINKGVNVGTPKPKKEEVKNERPAVFRRFFNK